MNDWQQRVFALAGMAQAAIAVQQAARTGRVHHEAVVETLLNSVLNLEPESTEAVYGGVDGVRPGLILLAQQFRNNAQRDLEITRYMVGMVHLSRRLLSQPKSLDLLADRLHQVGRQYYEFGFDKHQVTASLASIYREVISPLGQPIKVNGSPQVLQQETNQHLIRALLLSGVRSAVLWQQVGGKRRQFLLGRKRMLAAVNELLSVSA